MKFGFRKPSLKKSLAARTSWKRYVRHSLGVKAPKGMGFLTNPRRAAYNWVYRKSTIGIHDLAKPEKTRSWQNTGGNKDNRSFGNLSRKQLSVLALFFLATLALYVGIIIVMLPLLIAS